MKRLFAMFVLTPGEQRLVIFVVLALVVGFWVKHEREMHLNDVSARDLGTSPAPFASPSPNER